MRILIAALAALAGIGASLAVGHEAGRRGWMLPVVGQITTWAGGASPPATNRPIDRPPPLDRKILYYRNPMGLPDTSPEPKKDSMGMDYLPVYADEAADTGIVSVSPGRLQTLGVRTAPVETRAAMMRTIRATGTVQLDERRLATVTTKIEGWVEKLDVAATGDPVKRGQALAWIYSPGLVAAEQEYLV